MGTRLSRRADLVSPDRSYRTEFGQFYVTNLKGSNYANLSYVYRAKFVLAQACSTVGETNDGQFSSGKCHELGQDLLGDRIQLTASDLNGNGIGDWVFWTLDGGIPKLVPVYNHAKVVDFLSSAEDLMGLKTLLTYGCMSDPRGYTPGVDWKKYTYSSAVNSAPYRVPIKKSYAKARTKFLGRGWQGFKEVNMLDDTDSVFMTETYHQTWPLTGIKKQIGTKRSEAKLLKSVLSS
ncbi:unnamed protein product [Clonostachys rosea]|uniref:Rhamnogalacturonan lyase domain-containing protein n=1 Tax=Bionectria ochroleuca TaxID=29856 RepID=A0ABY6V1X5_BIOOC|nr:unnamed protein product [Clonostachys rosea]